MTGSRASATSCSTSSCPPRARWPRRRHRGRRSRSPPAGQAANVAAWVVALGGSAVVFGPQGPGSGRLAVAALTERGIDVVGPPVERSGSRRLAGDGRAPVAGVRRRARGVARRGRAGPVARRRRLAVRLRLRPAAGGLSRPAGRSWPRAVGYGGGPVVRGDGRRVRRRPLPLAVAVPRARRWSSPTRTSGRPAEASSTASWCSSTEPAGATFGGVRCPALPTDVVDVTGAGDAWPPDGSWADRNWPCRRPPAASRRSARSLAQGRASRR